MTFKRNSAVFLVCGDSVLLCKRIKTAKVPSNEGDLSVGVEVPFGGYWSPFAGAIEEGENPMATAIRELKEESKVDRSITDLIYIKTVHYEGSELNLYAIEEESFPQIKLDHEHTDYGFFKIDSLTELPAFEYKIDEEIISALKMYKKKRN
jgi:8-oxo-dGTP pyrophosphatase MutT (NUDIX family)